MMMQIGVGDVFTYGKEHWMIMDIKENMFVCKNKQSGAVVEFNKDIVRKLMQ